MTTPDIQPCTCCYHDSGELLANLRRHIKHVVVLVLENRSFDNLCGYMQGKEPGQNPELQGVNPGFVDADTMSRFSNPIDPHDPYSPRVPVSSDARAVTVDPPHEFVSINWQLFGNAEEPADKNVSPSMQGTILNVWKNATNYWLSDGSTHPSYDKRIAKQVMECFSPQDVPVLHELVQEFGLCDHWFSSLPGPTLPNRYMLLSCTTKGIISNAFNPPLPASIEQDEWLDFSGEAPGQGAAAASKLLPPTPTHYDQKTLCDLFAEATDAHGQPRFANPWRIYYHDFPIALGLTRLQKDFGPNAHPNRFHLFPQFVEDCNTGNLPTFAFIEPRYLDFRMWPENEQHPPADIKFGEYLIADVYQALRNSPAWEHTMLIVTYDEHGALYDHVPPPRTVPPDSHQSLDPPFAFDRLGLRVPTVIISPWVPRGTLIKKPLCHSSISATLSKIFDLPTLTQRDRWALQEGWTFEDVLSLKTPRLSDAEVPHGVARRPGSLGEIMQATLVAQHPFPPHLEYTIQELHRLREELHNFETRWQATHVSPEYYAPAPRPLHAVAQDYTWHKIQAYSHFLGRTHPVVAQMGEVDHQRQIIQEEQRVVEHVTTSQAMYALPQISRWPSPLPYKRREGPLPSPHSRWVS